MADLYRRRVEVLVGDAAEALLIKDLMIQFEIERKADATPAAGEIAVYNLNESNETRIRERGRRLRLSAGYEDGRYGLLADGDVREVRREKSGMDRITRIQLGGQVRRRTMAAVNLSYEGETPVRQIFTDAAAELEGLTLGPLDLVPADAAESDFRFQGKATTLMTGILPTDLRWYEDNGVIRVTKRGESSDDRTGAQTLVVSERTGMIGSPAVTDEGLTVTTLIDHRLGLDARVRVESAVLAQAASGDAASERAVEESTAGKVTRLRHAGDNRSGRFETEIDLRPLP